MVLRLPRGIAFIRKLGVHNIVLDTACSADRTENLLDYVLQIDWQETP